MASLAPRRATNLSTLLGLALVGSLGCGQDDGGVISVGDKARQDDEGPSEPGADDEPDEEGDDAAPGDDPVEDDDGGEDDLRPGVMILPGTPLPDDDVVSDDDTSSAPASPDPADDDLAPSGDDDGEGGSAPVPTPVPNGGSAAQPAAPQGGQAPTPSPVTPTPEPTNPSPTPTPTGECGAGVVDDFSTCDGDICTGEGRAGTWFDYAGDGIGLDEGQTGVRVPTTDWSDQSCAMILAGGDNLTGTEFYAGIGLALADQYAYDLSAYTGVTFSIETDSLVYFTLRDTSDQYFIPPSPSGQTSGTQSFSVPFSSLSAREDSPGAILDLTRAVEFQWTVVNPAAGFGLALHSVTLY